MFKNTTLAPRSCSAVDSHEPRMHSSDDDNAMHTHARLGRIDNLESQLLNWQKG
jgi:hypothetical protein